MSIEITITPPAGDPVVLDAIGVEGAIGSNGWTPVASIESDGARRVLKIVDWAGGAGAKPTVGLYVGSGSTLVSDIAQAVDIRGTQGVQGPQGEPGQILTSGSIFTGDGVPNNADGVDNDIYIDNLTADLYQKQSGVWVLQTNIRGAKGDKGDQGDAGVAGTAGADGATIFVGSGLPDNGLGVVGDLYLESTTFTLYNKTGASVWSQIGVIRGSDGSSIRIASGSPANSLGANGDSYIDSATGNLYAKTAGTYSLVGNLKGPQGVAGAQGVQGVAGPTGSSTLFGSGAPASGLGADGDSYIDVVAYHLYTKSAGAWTDNGSLKGANGADGVGNAIFTGIGAPGTISGSIPGDIYINRTNGDVYQKVGASWGSPVLNIKGPQGDPGAQGIQGNPGVAGPAGTSVLVGSIPPTNAIGNNGDSYIDKVAGNLYGPKTSGTWPSPPLSLVGPQGNQGVKGDTGANGSNFLSGSGVPDNVTVGVVGDTYLDVATGNLYGPKTGSGWGSTVGSLKGAQGIQGIQGIKGDTGTRGSAWFTGSGVPGTVSGAIDGDFYLNSANGDVYKLVSGSWSHEGFSIKGATGDQGLTGNTGTRGSLWYTGAGAPGTISGQAEGDLYLRSSNGEVYKFTSGAWADQGFSVQGPQGVAGNDGAAGPSNLPMTSVSAARTVGSGDKGTCLSHPASDVTARTWTIDNTSGWAAGDTVSFLNNNGAGVITIGISGTSAILRQTGTSNTGNRTLAANGMATAVRSPDNLTWYISGVGLT